MSFELENRLARKLAVSALAGEDWWSLVETAWKEPGEKVIVQAAGEGREPIFLKARDGLGKLADRTRLELSGAVRVDVGINFFRINGWKTGRENASANAI